MPRITRTLTNIDQPLIEAGTYPYNGQSGYWTEGYQLFKTITISYDTTSTGQTAQLAIVDCQRYGSTSGVPGTFKSHNIYLCLKPGSLTYMSNVSWSITYYRFSAITGKFIEVSEPFEISRSTGRSLYTYRESSIHPEAMTVVGTVMVPSTTTFNTSKAMIANTLSPAGFGHAVIGADVYTQINTSQGNQFTEDVYNFYRQAPPGPTPTGDFEVTFDVYSTASGYYDIYGSDLVNPPSPYTAKSYYVVVKEGVTSAFGGEIISTEMYSNVSGTHLNWNDIYDTLDDDDDRAHVLDLGHMNLIIILGHIDGETTATNSPDPSQIVIDRQCGVRVKKNGDLEAITMSNYCHIIVHPRETRNTDDEYDDDDSSIAVQVPGQAMSVDNLLTTSYALTEEALRNFGHWLWVNNLDVQFSKMQTAPIENVISCKRIPFDTEEYINQPGDLDSEIKCGNLHSGVGIDATTGDYDGTVRRAVSGHKQVIGEMVIPTFHSASRGSWIDMLSNISIYLPYCGIQTIPTGICYKQEKDDDGMPYLKGRKLRVEYYFDIVYGTCAAILYFDDTMYACYNGTCGMDIPITASNRAEQQLGLIGTGANAIAGTVAGVAKSAISGAAVGGGVGALIGAGIGLAGGLIQGAADTTVQAMTMDTHYTTAGGFSSQIASFMSSSVTLIIDHVKYTRPSTYAHDNGFPCYLTRNLSKLKGYTELDGACELQHINCLEEERRELKKALMEGFYLNTDAANIGEA